MGSVWRTVPDRLGPLGDGPRTGTMHSRRRTEGSIVAEALLFWLLTWAMLGAIGIMLYYTNGAAP